jgi:excisionase family DNA binding protein
LSEIRLPFGLGDDALRELADALRPYLGGSDGPEPWVGVAEAAAHLGCKPQRVYNLVHARAIPHRKDGSRLLFRLSDLDDWLSE